MNNINQSYSQIPETITWIFDDETLTISGNGAMPDYPLPNEKICNSNRESIITVKN